MLILNKEELKNYSAPYRLWQGIPSIEVTSKGRIFSVFYSGETKEQINNYVVLLKSDNGVDFGEPIAVVFKKNYRCFDPCLWIDPLGRLWLTWAIAPEQAVYASVCENPDADELSWSEVRKIGNDVMMNKPTILSTGEWIFPMAVWKKGMTLSNPNCSDNERKAYAYKTVDCGKNFSRLGGVEIKDRSFDEHMILELADGRLAMFIRTTYGIGVSYSFDRGITWTKGEDSTFKGPCSRFFIKRLKSGRILLINHYNYTGRNNLTAMLSDDECKNFKYKLLLDERANVSYPDAKEADDGYIYITYDRERGDSLKSLDQTYSKAREILYAKITEEDIINGSLTNDGSKLKCIISKLGKYALENENPYNEFGRFSDEELANFVSDKNDDEIVGVLFDYYGVSCLNMHKLNNIKLDKLIEKLSCASDRHKTICEIVALVRSVKPGETSEAPIVERIKKMIENDISDEFTIKEMAEKLGISMYYMCHLFKKTTGLTIGDFKKGARLTKAKRLLVGSDKKISEIAHECGFGSDSYFSKVFVASEGISPSEYRGFVKK